MSRFPQDLLEAFVAEEVLGVVGAGLSTPAGLPSWRALVSEMIEQCELHVPGFADATELRTMLEHNLLPEVADECRARMGNAIFQGLLYRIFRTPAVRPTAVHRALFQLPFLGLLTTNFDTLLEQAFVETRPDSGVPRVYTQENVPQLARLASERGFSILKLHGDVDDISSIILTAGDYQRLMERQTAYPRAFSTLLSTRTLLFVGYGLQDQDLRLILQEHALTFQKYGRRHFAMVADPGTVMARNLQDRFNIHVLAYSGSEDHSELLPVLRSLRDAVEELRSRSVSRGTPGEGISEQEREKRSIRSFMDHEREACQRLAALIPMDRAEYLRDCASKVEFNEAELDLIRRSIESGEHAKPREESLEAQLRQAQKMEAIGQLAGGVAHDFNNILSVISGYSELLLRGISPDDSMRGYAKEILTASDRAASLIRQLLAFSRRQVLAPQVLDLNVVVTNMERMLRRLIREDVDLETSLDPNLGRVKADPGQIEQIILNLAVNARDAMPKGGRLILETANADLDDAFAVTHAGIVPGQYVRLAVSDTGTGIDAETQGHMFEPFFTTKRQGKGTGLGLATVYGSVKQHGGSIYVRSEVGRGTTFEIFFPRAASEVQEAKPHVPPSTGLSGRRVLLVEDDRSTLDLVASILRKENCVVLTASDAAEALLTCDTHDAIDILLTDLMLPGMNGTELALQVVGRFPSVCVVFVTGYGGQPDLAPFGSKHQPAAFLRKPFKTEELLQVLRECGKRSPKRKRPKGGQRTRRASR